MPDRGPEIVNWLYEVLQIDDEWSTRDSRGFQWLPWQLSQFVGVTEPLPEDPERIRLYAETTVCDGVEDGPVVDVTMQRVAQEWTVGPVLLDRQRGAAFFHSSLLRGLDERNSISERWFALVVAMQAVAAHEVADELARALGGEPAFAAHPLSGERIEPDGMLNLLPLPDSSKTESCLAGSLGTVLEAVPERVRQWIASAGRGENGRRLVGEVPFSGLRTSADPAARGPESSLLQVFADQPHPIWGTGLTVQLLLPISFGTPDGYRAAQQLAGLEASTLTPQQPWGTWVYDEGQDTLEHRTFLPEVVLSPLDEQSRIMFLAQVLLAAAVVRSRWAADQLGIEWSG